MIKIYFLDFLGAEADNLPTSFIPPFVAETKNKELKKARVFSYLLLNKAYTESFFGDMPSVLKDENGRPFLDGSDIDFNISHSGDFASVIISDEGKVGVDIQKITKEVSIRLREKVEKDPIRLSPAFEKAELIFLKADGTGSSFSEAAPTLTDGEIPFFSAWTRREALAKADGRGLSLLSHIDTEDFSVISLGTLECAMSRYAFCAVKENKSP